LLRSEPGEPPREGCGRERWIVERDDDTRSSTAPARKVGCRADLRQCVLDDASRGAIKRARGRSGRGDDGDETGEKRETSHERCC
jgi:hypothetical protein